MKKTNLQRIFENIEMARIKKEKAMKDKEREKEYTQKVGASMERQKSE